MTIRVVTFDIGGTLLFPRPSVSETFLQVAAEFGYAPDAATVAQASRDAYRLYEREYAKDGDFWCTSAGCRWIWQLQYAAMCDALGVVAHKADIVAATHASFERGHHWGVFEDAPEALRALQAAGFVLGVVSNWDACLHAILADLGLDRYFSFVLASAEAGLRKPDPRFFAQAVRAAGFAPEEILHVGDLDVEDGLAPQAAGMHSVIIDRHTPARTHAAGLPVIDDLRKLVCDTYPGQVSHRPGQVSHFIH